MLSLYSVHYTVLFHNQGGYQNSLILEALELLPAQAERAVVSKGFYDALLWKALEKSPSHALITFSYIITNDIL